MGKNTKKATAKRVPFNWAKLKKMAESGASILEMAEATDAHFRTSKSTDRTKPTRARLSIAANSGVHIEGRLVRFKRRVKLHTVESKPKPTATKQAKNPTTKAKVQKAKVTGKKTPKVVPLSPSPDKTIQPEA